MPSGKLGEALGYFITQWSKLVRYVEYPCLAIDTDSAENAIRPFALGRRNWLFADTVKGSKASAALYSIVSTARANGLEPYAYLRRLFAELPRAKTVANFEALLPFSTAAVKEGAALLDRLRLGTFAHFPDSKSPPNQPTS